MLQSFLLNTILITGIGNAKVIDNIRTQSFQYCFFPNILKKFSFSFPQHIQGLFVDSVERYILSSTNKTKFKMKCIYVSQNIVFVSHISCSFFDFCFFIHRTILNMFCFLEPYSKYNLHSNRIWIIWYEINWICCSKTKRRWK